MTEKHLRANGGGSGAKVVMKNTYPNLSDIVHTDFELDRVIQTIDAADLGIIVIIMMNVELCIYC